MGISMKFVRHNTHSKENREQRKKDQPKEIYAGDKFKTHVLQGIKREREREGESGRERQ